MESSVRTPIPDFRGRPAKPRCVLESTDTKAPRFVSLLRAIGDGSPGWGGEGGAAGAGDHGGKARKSYISLYIGYN
jgi:hypothetical protein